MNQKGLSLVQGVRQFRRGAEKRAQGLSEVLGLFAAGLHAGRNFLLLHASVLEPNFHLSLGQVEHLGQCQASGSTNVPKKNRQGLGNRVGMRPRAVELTC